MLTVGQFYFLCFTVLCDHDSIFQLSWFFAQQASKRHRSITSAALYVDTMYGLALNHLVFCPAMIRAWFDAASDAFCQS